MPITELQKEQRQKYVGSSDMPVLCGVNLNAKGEQYSNVADLWLEKTGRVKPKEESDKAKKGRIFERAILDFCDEELGKRTERNLPTFVKGDLCANLDSAKMQDKQGSRLTVIDAEHGLKILLDVAVDYAQEAKFTGFRELWGEDVTDLPDSVLVQCNTQMYVCGHALTWVPVMFPVYRDFEFKRYYVERNDELIEQLCERANWFMDCVRKDTPPEGIVPSLETLKRRRRQAEPTIQLSAEVAAIWDVKEEWAEQRKAAEKQEEELKAQVIAALGDHEVGSFPDGRIFSYRQQNGQRVIDLDALKLTLGSIASGIRAHRDRDALDLLAQEVDGLYDLMVKQTTKRVPRVKAARAGRRR